MSDMQWIAIMIVSGIGLSICLYFMHKSKHGVPGLKAIDPDFQWPDMSMSYTPDKLFTTFDGIGKEGQKKLKRLWLIDFAFIICLLGAMAYITNKNVLIDVIRYVMYGAATARAVLDAAENMLLMAVSDAYPKTKRTRMAKISSIVTLGKWVMMGIWIAGLFVQLGIRSVQISGS
ncbi:MAG: hypothetical protein GX096_03275 [Clostridiales bacterium]|nr:hypothetical protein [Clostridiales bacterium]